MDWGLADALAGARFEERPPLPKLEFSALALLLAQIAAILLVSRLLGRVTRRLGQPLVIAEVLAGIVLGPSLLGWLWPGAMHALFPPESLDVLKMLSQVGLVLFMFMVGLEFDPRLLKGRTHSSVAISHTSILAPFALGSAVAWWLYDDYSSPDVPFLSFFLFLGAAMSVTAFPVLARILSERQLLTSRVGAISIVCAAVDDVTAWCILAFVVAVARAEGAEQALWTTGFAALFILGMLLLARPVLRRLAARVAARSGVTPSVIAAALLGLLLSSATTEVIGIHALFGAFFFGAILPKQGALAETLADRVETVAVVLLLPLFFAYSGLRTQIALVSQPAEWLVTGILILTATVGKFGGSAVAARLTGLRWREASAIGVLMNTRGLMELIVLNLGMDLGVISPTVFTMLVIMALVTTFATTPVLRWVYPDEELARDRWSTAPEPPQSGPGPFTLMLYASDELDGPGLASLAAALAGRRAEPARVLALHLWAPTHRPSVERRRGDAERGDGPLGPLLERARELGLGVLPLSFVSAAPAADVCRTAKAKQAGVILLAAHKPLLLEGRMSGTVGDVIAQAEMPVGVLLDRGLGQVERVLIAYAGGPEDLEALRVGRRLGQAPGVQLTLLHVVAPGEAARPGPGRAQVAEVLADPELDAQSLRLLVVEHEFPPEAVLEEARRGYDLIVLGMNARWGLEAGRIGPKRRRVLVESSVSILAVQPPLGAAAERAGVRETLAPLAEAGG